MKILNLKTIFCIAFALSITILSAGNTLQNQSYFNRIYATIQEWFARTPLVPGWQTTPKQKEEAQAKLIELLADKNTLETEIKENAELTTDQIEEKHIQITTLQQKIDAQKIILGEKWSSRRKLITGASGIGLGALGLAKLTSFYKIPSSTPIKPTNTQPIPLTISNETITAKLPLKPTPGVEYTWEVYKWMSGKLKDIDTKDPSSLIWDQKKGEKLTFILHAKLPNTNEWVAVARFKPYNDATEKNFEFLKNYQQYLS